MDNQIKSVSFIGAGKVARQLASWLFEKDVDIWQVCNRTPSAGEELATAVEAEVISDPVDLNLDVGLVIIAVSDDAIRSMAESLPKSETLVVHTSGTRGMADLSKHERRGVFYPLQTFSNGVDVDFRKIPVCIEAATPEDETLLKTSCLGWGSYSYLLNSAQRETLHISAVMANNFTNHLWGKSFELLRSHEIEPDILFPLMLESVNKAIHADPYAIQTGPAVRGDEETISRHLQKLKSNGGNLHEIYRLMTNSIQENKQDGEL